MAEIILFPFPNPKEKEWTQLKQSSAGIAGLTLQRKMKTISLHE
jgi:hypothetical protein